MKKGLGYFLVFLMSLYISVVYQNCGNSSVRANSSGDEGIQIEPIAPGTETGDQTGTGTDGDNTTNSPFGLNFATNESLIYFTTNSVTAVTNTSHLNFKQRDMYLDSVIYESPTVSFQVDLPAGYCANSALPQCEHINDSACSGAGCFTPPAPVRCHWQRRMGDAEVQAAFAGIEAIRIFTREVSTTDPFIGGCNDPMLRLFKTNGDVDVSLADVGCVADDQAYVKTETGNAVRTMFETELANLITLTDNTGGDEYCSSYSSYDQEFTKVTYNSVSGFTTREDSFVYSATIEYDGTYYSANIRFKKPGNDQNTYCAGGLTLNQVELDTLFPAEGLKYEIFRTGSIVADVGNAEIIYEDPIDGGAQWRFFLDRASALGNQGGAIIEQSQADAIKDLVETVIVDKAEDLGDALQVCTTP